MISCTPCFSASSSMKRKAAASAGLLVSVKIGITWRGRLANHVRRKRHHVRPKLVARDQGSGQIVLGFHGDQLSILPEQDVDVRGCPFESVMERHADALHLEAVFCSSVGDA